MMREELQAIGQRLRATRLERDHTLEEVAAATRIRLRFLEAIEAGEPDDTLSEMQLRGFLRNYAAFLHLDLDAMLAAYQQVLETRRGAARFGLFRGGKEEAPPAVPVVPLYGSDPVKTPPGPIPRVAHHSDFAPVEMRSRFSMVLLTVMAVSLVGIALAAGIIAVSQLASSGDDAPAPLAIETEDLMIGATPELFATEFMTEEAATPTIAAGGVIVNPPSMTGADQISISLEATQRSWVRLVVDGSVEYEGLLRPGTALQYHGQQSITLRTSNAGGLEVVVNNQPLGSLGARGEGYEQTFTLDEPIVPNAQPSATATLPVATQAPVTQEPTSLPTEELPTLPPPPQPLVTEEAAP